MHIKLRFSSKLINNSSELLIAEITNFVKIIKNFKNSMIFYDIYINIILKIACNKNIIYEKIFFKRIRSFRE